MRHVPALLILLPALFSVQAAYGHAMHVQCGVVSPDRLIVNASWGKDEPVAKGAVTVFDANGDALSHGTTDAAGRFACTIQKPQALIVEVVFAGHRGECEVDAAAFEASTAKPAEDDVLLLQSAVGEDDAHHHDHAHGEGDGHVHEADGHSHDHDHGHDHAADHDHAHHEADHHTHKTAAHSHADDHEHTADDDHRAELLAGIALILSAASFLMVLSLRRDVKTLLENARGHRS